MLLWLPIFRYEHLRYEHCFRSSIVIYMISRPWNFFFLRSEIEFAVSTQLHLLNYLLIMKIYPTFFMNIILLKHSEIFILEKSFRPLCCFCLTEMTRRSPNAKSAKHHHLLHFTVEIVSTSCKVAWFFQFYYNCWLKSRNLAWGWVNNNIFYRALMGTSSHLKSHFSN